MKIVSKIALVGIVPLFVVVTANAAPSLSIGTGQGRAGETILLPVTFNTDISLQAVTLSVDMSFTAADILLGTPVTTNKIDPATVHATYTGSGNLKVVIAPLPNLAAFSSGVLINLPVTILRAGTTNISTNVNGNYALVDSTPHVTGSGVLNTSVVMTASTADPSRDSDGDGLTDLYETSQGLNGYDGNDAFLDADGDGINNLTEKTLGTSLFVADTDGDGLADGFERDHGLDPKAAVTQAVLDSDADGDTLTLWQESIYDTNPNSADTDGDTVADNIELRYGFNPLVANGQYDDADRDYLTDLAELNTHNTDPSNNDTDFDGMDDRFEVTYSVLNPRNALDARYDSETPIPDGLINLVEFTLNTNPMSIDSDGDCMKDGFENENGFNPASSTDGSLDKDDDGLNNKAECQSGSNTFVADTDSDGMKDGFEHTYSFPFTNPNTDAANNGTACTGSTLNNGTGPGNDADCDTLTNLVEHNLKTNPKSVDTDKDSVNDPTEVAQGRNPAVNEPAIMAIINTLLL